jgi:hypothetical protein
VEFAAARSIHVPLVDVTYSASTLYDWSLGCTGILLSITAMGLKVMTYGNWSNRGRIPVGLTAGGEANSLLMKVCFDTQGLLKKTLSDNTLGQP